jgi:hypothetical protein
MRKFKALFHSISLLTLKLEMQFDDVVMVITRLSGSKDNSTKRPVLAIPI